MEVPPEERPVVQACKEYAESALFEEAFMPADLDYGRLLGIWKTACDQVGWNKPPSRRTERHVSSWKFNQPRYGHRTDWSTAAASEVECARACS